MYRSFLKCDDPKGVIGCGTIRKYRTRSHKVKDKTKTQKTCEIMETSLINKRYKEEKKVAKEGLGNLIGPSSLQLTEVSEEDRSWNNMLDSWSRDIIGEGKSEDIAKDILKGALDLQDSLSMIRKLQEEASQHTALFGRKHTTKSERDRIDGSKIGRRQANLFGEQSNAKGFQRPQPSAGGSSSNCKEELKKVIKESLVRQSMFPETTEGFDSGLETFSISTSQCSGVRTNNSLSDPSLSAIASKIERGPSLVFKLMGLEEGPSKSFAAVKQKLLDCEIDMSKVRKNDSIPERVNPEQRALRETLDTMHFKGILKESFVKDSKLHVHHFNDTSSKQFVDLSHIALMKPQCTLYQQSEKSTYIPVLPKELTKLRGEISSSKTIKHRKGSSSTNMGKEMETGIRKRLNKVEGPKFHKEVIKLDAKGSNPVEEYSGRKNQMKKQSPVAEPEPAKLTVEQIRQREKKKNYPEIRISTRLEDELLMVCEADGFINNIGEKCKLRKSSSGDELIMALKSEHKNDAITAYSIDADKEGTELKHFLLTSPSFIGHTKKLFNLDVDCPNTPQKDETISSRANTRLYLDCAYELTEHRLVEEICDGIENLKFYREDYDSWEEDFADNDVFAMMEKDMKCNGEINGIWESGWRTGFCADEAQLVVNKIQSMLISGLIEELVIDLSA
ncbi:hypothetical protein ACSQ67_005168 [Phaseolus vulgaris]